MKELGKVCEKALACLLNNYSDFSISTIDSFFQDLLRTFSYEAALSDNFQLELDQDYLSRLAIDSTLDDIDRGKHLSSNDADWTRLIMNSGKSGTSWNIFNRKDSKASTYSEIKNALKNLEKEDYKVIKDVLEDYFDDPENSRALILSYKEFRKRAETERQNAIDEIKKDAAALRSLLEKKGISPGMCNSYLASHLDKSDRLTIESQVDESTPFKCSSFLNKGTIFTKSSKVSQHDKEDIDRVALEMYRKVEDFKDIKNTPTWALWKILGHMIPLLGIMNVVRTRLSDVLIGNNIIKLADTVTILRQIVNDDDTSFIYERLGNKIDHYLIDEFQDTSRLQWQLLRPLIVESESRGKDNLVIGDAKQSIYRFRNADSSLITKTLPAQFSKIEIRGNRMEENTNWRSYQRIVEFNNFFFSHLAFLMDNITSEFSGYIDFKDLYSNVVQKPHNKNGKGYVEIRIEKKIDKKSNEPIPLNSLQQVPQLIMELRDRGYDQKDIAVLVSENKEGRQIIDSIISFNASLEEGVKPLEFVSEEALYVSSSEAVGIIIMVLERIAFSILTPGQKGLMDSERKRYGRLLSKEIRDNFMVFMLRYPELPVHEQLDKFFLQEDTDDILKKLLENMQTTALPAMVEAIIESFVPQEMRDRECVFLNAFIDIVTDYCERFSADPVSFLEWWKERGYKLSITLPEDTDAVNIMTIHKSKGLEFKCVILPFATSTFTPVATKKEWRWVPSPKSLDDLNLPPFLPVETSPSLLSTEYAPYYEDYFNHVVMDRINSLYVAFTRAVEELYIFTKEDSPKTIGGILIDILSNSGKEALPIEKGLERFVLDPDLIHFDLTKGIATIGEKTTVKKNTEDRDTQFTINRYIINSNRPMLHVVESEDDRNITSQVYGNETEEQDEGNLLHEAMSFVNTEDDIHAAFLKLQMAGKISTARAHDWEEMIRKAMKNPLVRSWFKSGLEILNEREIFRHGYDALRPDRIVVDHEASSATVIDYKFGEYEDNDKYLKQVKEYMNVFRKATGISNVNGYIWYVRKNHIVEVNGSK